jgi:hypothetical protein
MAQKLVTTFTLFVFILLMFFGLVLLTGAPA